MKEIVVILIGCGNALGDGDHAEDLLLSNNSVSLPLSDLNCYFMLKQTEKDGGLCYIGKPA